MDEHIKQVETEEERTARIIATMMNEGQYSQQHPTPSTSKDTVNPEPTRNPQPRGIYNWREWQDGEYHVIKQGIDFTLPVPRMQMLVYRRAQDTGMVVKTEKLPENMIGLLFAPNKVALLRKWRALEEA